MLRSGDPINPETRLIRFEDPIMVIPHLAIHFNRAVNEGNKLSKQKDMLPVISISEPNAKGLIRRLVAEKLGVDEDSIIDYDLSLYSCQKAALVGINKDIMVRMFDVPTEQMYKMDCEKYLLNPNLPETRQQLEEIKNLEHKKDSIQKTNILHSILNK